MMTPGPSKWSFASAREPARFGVAQENLAPETEHASGIGRGTLCGIPEEQIARYRHHFRPGHPRACPSCRVRVAAAPTVPCAQERLHDQVLAAEPEPLRTRLVQALREGARIIIWLGGPADRIGYHAHLDTITEGHEAVREQLATHEPIQIARVDHPLGEFVVLLPQHAPPLIARSAR